MYNQILGITLLISVTIHEKKIGQKSDFLVFWLYLDVHARTEDVEVQYRYFYITLLVCRR